jgi:hypothetical protein
MRAVRITVVLGLALTTVALAVTLARAPLVIAGTNSIQSAVKLTSGESITACQANEVLPRGTSAIRLSLEALIGPKVTVTVRAGTLTLARGARNAGWKAADVTVPVGRVRHTTPHVQVCFALAPSYTPVIVLGERTRQAVAASTAEGPLPGRVSVEYMRQGDRSWLSLASSVAQRMGLGHAGSGAWIALLVAALAATVAALSVWLVLRELR